MLIGEERGGEERGGGERERERRDLSRSLCLLNKTTSFNYLLLQKRYVHTLFTL